MLISQRTGERVHGEHRGRGHTLVRWTFAEPGWLGTASGVGGAGSEHSWGELRWVGRYEHARSAMVSTMSRWPPVGGHLLMH